MRKGGCEKRERVWAKAEREMEREQADKDGRKRTETRQKKKRKRNIILNDLMNDFATKNSWRPV